MNYADEDGEEYTDFAELEGEVIEEVIAVSLE